MVPTRTYGDEAIATDIVDALKRNSLVDAESVDVRVANGTVTLTGSVPNLAARPPGGPRHRLAYAGRDGRTRESYHRC